MSVSPYGQQSMNRWQGTNPDEYASQSAHVVRADVRMFSGCRDSQTSADVHDVSQFGLPSNSGPGGAGGACTGAILSVLYEPSEAPVNVSWLQLLVSMRQSLQQKGYSQVPELSTSKQMNLDLPFTVFNPKAEFAQQPKRRALFIGINYRGQRGELRGCHNDVKMMGRYLRSIGFCQGDGDKDVLVLMDDGVHTPPTRENILNGFRWLVRDANPGDALFVHYSGHGGNVPDKNGDEADGMDETLVPLDYEQSGQIIDDLVLAELVMPLPEDCVMTAVFDCCHSGSIMDLPYVFRMNGETEEAIRNGDMPHEMMANDAFNMVIMYALATSVMNLLSSGGGVGGIADIVSGGMYRQLGGDSGGGVDGDVCDCLGPCLEGLIGLVDGGGGDDEE